METIVIIDGDTKAQKQLSTTVHPSFGTVALDNLEDGIELLEYEACVGVLLDPFTVSGGCPHEFIRVVLDEENGWSTIPLIVMSHKLEFDVVARYWSLGVDECVGKPFDPGRIWGMMYDLIAVNRYSSIE